mmetsp:Transcript_30499/g.62241  ORF Transcript_30499/g.62241 Transcript_30499/m.62241 type:complete len:258 (-) Transcript_30499:158-931(-)
MTNVTAAGTSDELSTTVEMIQSWAFLLHNLSITAKSRMDRNFVIPMAKYVLLSLFDPLKLSVLVRKAEEFIADIVIGDRKSYEISNGRCLFGSTSTIFSLLFPSDTSLPENEGTGMRRSHTKKANRSSSANLPDKRNLSSRPAFLPVDHRPILAGCAVESMTEVVIAVTFRILPKIGRSSNALNRAKRRAYTTQYFSKSSTSDLKAFISVFCFCCFFSMDGVTRRPRRPAFSGFLPESFDGSSVSPSAVSTCSYKFR